MWIKCGPKKHGEVSEDGVKNQQTLPRMNQHDFLNMFYLLMMNHWMEMMETLCFFLATSCCNVDISWSHGSQVAPKGCATRSQIAVVLDIQTLRKGSRWQLAEDGTDISKTYSMFIWSFSGMWKPVKALVVVCDSVFLVYLFKTAISTNNFQETYELLVKGEFVSSRWNGWPLSSTTQCNEAG